MWNATYYKPFQVATGEDDVGNNKYGLEFDKKKKQNYTFYDNIESLEDQLYKKKLLEKINPTEYTKEYVMHSSYILNGHYDNAVMSFDKKNNKYVKMKFYSDKYIVTKSTEIPEIYTEYIHKRRILKQLINI